MADLSREISTFGGKTEMRIFTIGHKGKAPETFFNALKDAEIEQVIDIRLRPSSTYAGFAKANLLKFNLSICNINYRHEYLLAPTKKLFTSFKKENLPWENYETRFRHLLELVTVERIFTPDYFQKRSVLLCACQTADQCHRRLAADYLIEKWGEGEIVHL
jgi:uncharacterized protein (DUF488 family)